MMRFEHMLHKPGGFLPIACLIPLATLAAVWLSFPKTAGVLPLDDAYIDFVYARNLAESGVPVFNPGEASLGSSSPLWVLLLAAGHLLGLEAYWTSLWLSAAAFAGVVLLTAGLAGFFAARSGFSETHQLGCAILAALLVAGNGNLHWLALCGTETLMSLFLSLLSVHLYWRRGFAPATGLAAGLVVLGRYPGILLGAIFLALDILQGKSGWRRGLTAMALVTLPYMVLSWIVTGGVIPTSIQGKLFTHAESGFDGRSLLGYLEGFLRYQIYLPQNIVILGALAILAAMTLWKHWRSIPKLQVSFIDRWLPAISLALWGAAHLMFHALGFRTLHHHTRYLAEEYIILSIGGASGLFQLIRQRACLAKALSLLAIAGSLYCAYASLPYWRKVYEGNVRHMQSVHIPMADWINKNTPLEARVASLDIGVLGYFANRHMLDLGGRIDPEIHPWLQLRFCGEYLRQKQADYIVYLRVPETDTFTGIYRATFEGGFLLKQNFLTAYSTPPIPAPSSTHSFTMAIYRVEGWYPRDRAGILRAHQGDSPSFEPGESVGQSTRLSGAVIAESDKNVAEPLSQNSMAAWKDAPLRLLGCSIRPRSIRTIPLEPTAIEFSFLFRAERPLDENYGLRIAFVDALDGRTLNSFFYPLVHGLLTAEQWPVGRLIQDQMIYLWPSEIPAGRFRVEAQLLRSRWDLWNDRSAGNRIQLGVLEVDPSDFDPIDHRKLPLLSASRREKRLYGLLEYFPQN